MNINREAKRERAKELFLQGYNCAQAVVAAYAPELDIPQKQLLRMASTFGGGMGGMRDVCGAVSGMTMVYGLLKGYDAPEDTDGKKAAYAAVQRMVRRFMKQQNGEMHCRELLTRAGIDPQNMPAPRTPEYYAKRPCPALIADCAGILADELNGEGE